MNATERVAADATWDGEASCKPKTRKIIYSKKTRKENYGPVWFLFFKIALESSFLKHRERHFSIL